MPIYSKKAATINVAASYRSISQNNLLIGHPQLAQLLQIQGCFGLGVAIAAVHQLGQKIGQEQGGEGRSFFCLTIDHQRAWHRLQQLLGHFQTAEFEFITQYGLVVPVSFTQTMEPFLWK